MGFSNRTSLQFAPGHFARGQVLGSGVACPPRSTMRLYLPRRRRTSPSPRSSCAVRGPPGEGDRTGAGRMHPPPEPALELIHCASLVHDDLPAFVQWPTRPTRQDSSVHPRPIPEPLGGCLTGDQPHPLPGLEGSFRAPRAGLPSGPAPRPSRPTMAPHISTSPHSACPVASVAGQGWRESEGDNQTFNRLSPPPRPARCSWAATQMGAILRGFGPRLLGRAGRRASAGVHSHASTTFLRDFSICSGRGAF